MASFCPELETCPVCGARGHCRIHDYYGRRIIDIRNGVPVTDNLCVLRVFCDSCEHAHAILPDIIIPYSGYSLFFILRVLGEYFARLHTVEFLCERYLISQKQLYKWLALWKSHKAEWLGVIHNAGTTDLAFLKQLLRMNSYSVFSPEFIRLTAHSFLQSHGNPILRHPQNARYCQKVFEPDYLFL